jgi:hypothetical protein
MIRKLLLPATTLLTWQPLSLLNGRQITVRIWRQWARASKDRKKSPIVSS